MKPKPLSALNHFTVPVAISSSFIRRATTRPRRADREPTGPGLQNLTPAPGHVFCGTSRRAGYDYELASPELLRRVQRIANVCGAYGVTLPQAAMAFPLRHPVVAGVVVGMRSAEEARRNAESFQAETPAHVWADLRSEGLLARSHLEWRLARYRNLAVQPLPLGLSRKVRE
jgi:aldo/keto reductase family protein